MPSNKKSLSPVHAKSNERLLVLVSLHPSGSSDSVSFHQEVPASWGLFLPATQVGEVAQRKSLRASVAKSGSSCYPYYSHTIGQIPVTWSNPTAREAGKGSFPMYTGRGSRSSERL